jgi:hypothetical protein
MLRMESECSSETVVPIYHTTQHHIPEEAAFTVTAVGTSRLYCRHAPYGTV